MVNPGDVSTIGYELSTLFAKGSVDASHTALISFEPPRRGLPHRRVPARPRRPARRPPFPNPPPGR
jgi:hypothetical protein